MEKLIAVSFAQIHLEFASTLHFSTKKKNSIRNLRRMQEVIPAI